MLQSNKREHIRSETMKCNVGGIDKAARIIIGTVLVVVGFTVPMNTTWQAVVWVLAAIALVTALVGFCPLNSLIGLNTCRHKPQV
jgi:hypothetical protein